MVTILNCYLYAKKSYGTLSKGADFFGQSCTIGNKKVPEPCSTIPLICKKYNLIRLTPYLR